MNKSKKSLIAASLLILLFTNQANAFVFTDLLAHVPTDRDDEPDGRVHPSL